MTVGAPRGTGAISFPGLGKGSSCLDRSRHLRDAGEQPWTVRWPGRAEGPRGTAWARPSMASALGLQGAHQGAPSPQFPSTLCFPKEEPQGRHPWASEGTGCRTGAAGRTVAGLQWGPVGLGACVWSAPPPRPVSHVRWVKVSFVPSLGPFYTRCPLLPQCLQNVWGRSPPLVFLQYPSLSFLAR